MANDDSAASPPAPLSELAAGLRREVETLDRELAEIEMLVKQARSEAARHETKRQQAAERLAALNPSPGTDPKEIIDASAQLTTLTRRAAIMESQVDVLTGKQKVVERFRETVARQAEALTASLEAGLAGEGGIYLPSGAPVLSAGAAGDAAEGQGELPNLPPVLSRVVMSAQEDLRRQLARSLHDGPAQSLTNIVLQAQIVERLMGSEPELARNEIRQLMAMVQTTLEATKSFIFEVRPMVLDDLGLVPTLRRAARDRGRRAHVAVEFDSVGPDRRLPVDLESGLFRILDEALGGFLSIRPDRVRIRLDWTDGLEGHIAAARGSSDAIELPPPAEPEAAKGKKGAVEVPAALVAMIEERRAAMAVKAQQALELPATTWREIQQRAATVGVTVELLADGSEVKVAATLPEPES